MKPKLYLLCALLLTLACNLFALAGKVTVPTVALPSTVSEADRAKIMAALQRSDCKFTGGDFLNWSTSLRYAGDSRSLSLFLDQLSCCPGVTVAVSFGSDLDPQTDWKVSHDAISNRFVVQVNLQSRQIKLEDLIIPDIKSLSKTKGEKAP